MENILNFDQPLDIGLFDRVVNVLFTGYGDEVIKVWCRIAPKYSLL